MHVKTAGLQEASPVDDGVDQDLDWVAVCQEVNDVEGVFDNSHLRVNSMASANFPDTFTNPRTTSLNALRLVKIWYGRI